MTVLIVTAGVVVYAGLCALVVGLCQMAARGDGLR